MQYVCIGVLSALLSVPLLAWSAPVSIVVHETAIVRGTEIRIGEVADVHAASAEVVASIQGIVIGQAPPAGQERMLHAAYIATRLRQHGFELDAFVITGPSRVAVTRVTQRIETGDIEAAVVQAIHARMPWQVDQTTVRTLRGIEAVVLPAGAVESEVSLPVNTDFLGPTSFTVTFRVNGNVEKRLYGTAQIEVTQEVVTTARPFTRHETITAEDIRMTSMNLARLPRRVLMTPEEVIGKQTKRPIQAHALIHTYEVQELPLIRKGDAVLLLVESRALKVSTMGEALEAGQQGDTIRVKNVSSDREVRGVVVDRKTVRIPF